jgi:endogenous inhibitor of DNA gyrase (YacG/DUF329 family)
MADAPKPDAPADPAAVRVTAAKCVRCGAPVHARYRPFCSQRCAEIDLGQWVTGGYRIPAEEDAAGPQDDEIDH